MKKVSSWHIGVAGEAFAAAQFARYGIDVSVQYGANQPEYDLIATKGDKMLKVSVKGSQDGKKTIFCLVQFQNVADDQLPRMYLATPAEIAQALHDSRSGLGETVLRENHVWGERASAAGTIDRLPEEWLFTKERAKLVFDTYA